MLKSIAVLVGSLFVCQFANADDRANLIGNWKLLSFENEFQDGSPRRAPYGQSPTGYIVFTAEGRMIAVVVGEGRKVAKTDEERAALLQSMFAYSGMYRLEGDKWITKVDVAWNPVWNGTEQMRYYKLEGDRLEVTAAWGNSPNLPGAPVTRGILMFERAK
jgi:hypothetical protein